MLALGWEQVSGPVSRMDRPEPEPGQVQELEPAREPACQMDRQGRPAPELVQARALEPEQARASAQEPECRTDPMDRQEQVLAQALERVPEPACQRGLPDQLVQERESVRGQAWAPVPGQVCQTDQPEPGQEPVPEQDQPVLAAERVQEPGCRRTDRSGRVRLAAGAGPAREQEFARHRLRCESSLRSARCRASSGQTAGPAWPNCAAIRSSGVRCLGYARASGRSGTARRRRLPPRLRCGNRRELRRADPGGRRSGRGSSSTLGRGCHH